ncbi:aldo/keto reductase [soil metagenome]
MNSKKRILGRSSLQVFPVGLGCMGMSDFYGTRDDQESTRTLHRALDLGVNFFDTADMYGFGDNETLIGKAFKGRPRDSYVIATKFGIIRDKSDSTKRGVRGDRAYVKEACEASLKRLGLDVIDLYYQHRVDPETPIEETVSAMAELVEEGKVRYLGLSEAAPATLKKAHAIHPITALQTEYSLWSRDPEDGPLAMCRELGVSLVPYSPLGRGFLTGEIKRIEDFAADDYRRHSPRFQGENFERNLKLVAQVEAMAIQKNITTAQLALAWVLSQDETLVPIPGTKKVPRLEENIGATKVMLSRDELAQLDRILPRGSAAGERYPAAMMGSLNR